MDNNWRASMPQVTRQEMEIRIWDAVVRNVPVLRLGTTVSFAYRAEEKIFQAATDRQDYFQRISFWEFPNEFGDLTNPHQARDTSGAETAGQSATIASQVQQARQRWLLQYEQWSLEFEQQEQQEQLPQELQAWQESRQQEQEQEQEQLQEEWQRQHSFLKIAQERMEEVETMPSRNFNNDQCDYLVDKLKEVIQSASLFTETSSAEAHHPALSLDMARKNESFKLLVGLANQVESFVHGCCNDAWLQAAMALTNVPEYVSSVGFNLELCRIVFCKECGGTQSLTFDQVVDLSIAEVEIIKRKAFTDSDNLINKVIKELPSLGSEEKDLAGYLLQRLRSVRPIPASDLRGLSSWDMTDLGSYFGKLFTRVQQNVRLGTCGSGATVDRATWLGTLVAVKTFYGPENPEFNARSGNLGRIVSS